MGILLYPRIVLKDKLAQGYESLDLRFGYKRSYQK